MNRVLGEVVPAIVLTVSTAIPIAIYARAIDLVNTASRMSPAVKQVVAKVQADGAGEIIYPAIGIAGGLIFYGILRSVGLLVRLRKNALLSETSATKSTIQSEPDPLPTEYPDAEETIRRNHPPQ